jgi:hypothetical protein
MATFSSRLYSTVYAHRKTFLEVGVLRCMGQFIERGSLLGESTDGNRMTVEKSFSQVPSLQHALLAITRLVYQLNK